MQNAQQVLDNEITKQCTVAVLFRAKEPKQDLMLVITFICNSAELKQGEHN